MWVSTQEIVALYLLSGREALTVAVQDYLAGDLDATIAPDVFRAIADALNERSCAT